MNEAFDNNYVSPQPGGSKGMAIASMVLGILSIVACCYWYLALICGIAAIVLGILHNKKNGSCGMSIAGIVCGIIGVVLTVVFLVLAAIGLAAFGGLSALENYGL